MRACAPSILVSLMRVCVKIDVSEVSLRSVWLFANESLVFLRLICGYFDFSCPKIGVFWVSYGLGVFWVL